MAGGNRPYARLPTSDPPLPYSTTPPLHHVLSVVRGPFLSVVIREIRGLALEITQSTLDRMHRIHRMEGIDFGLLGAHSVPLGDTLTLLLFPCWHFRGPPRTAVEAADFPPAWREHYRLRGALFRKLDRSSTVANCSGESCRRGSGEWAKLDAECCGRMGWSVCVVLGSSCLVPRAWFLVLGSSCLVLRAWFGFTSPRGERSGSQARVRGAVDLNHGWHGSTRMGISHKRHRIGPPMGKGMAPVP